jgi:hypothetical protein
MRLPLSLEHHEPDRARDALETKRVGGAEKFRT